jgi:hypothetical protein
MIENLVKKLLAKLSLKDLYDEIKSSDSVMCSLGLTIYAKNPALFAKLMRALVEETIKQNDPKMTDFLKAEIISLDGSESLSVNRVSKQKILATPKPSYIDDPCVKGSTRNERC